MSGRISDKMTPSSQYNGGKPASSSSPLTSSSSSSSSSLPSSASSSRLPSAPSSSSGSSHAPGGNGGRLSSNTTRFGLPPNVSFKNGIFKIGNSSSKGENEYEYCVRQRVVHLLALRTYKKPELVVRLMKGGIHESDYDILDSVVKGISVMAKDGRYTLAKHAWQYFCPGWPFYSAIDKQMAKCSSIRNQQVTQSRSSTSSMAAAVVSPAVNSTHSPSPPQKRVREDPADQTFVSKKQRIAHHPTSSRQHTTTTTTNSGSSFANSSTLPLTSGVTTVHHYSHRTGGGSTGSMSQVSDCGIDSVSTIASSGSSGKDDSPLPESPQYNCENQGKADDSSLQEDYMLQYRKIVTCEQWLQYKEDFNKEFEEYRHLHNNVTVVSKRFEHLKERISNTQEGSEAYEELYHQVLEEYKKCKSDREFQLHKRRVDYLEGKLSYIKQLIIDYDLDTHLNQCS